MDWTLTYQGTTKTLADWGIANLQRSLQSQAIDTVSFRIPGHEIDLAPPFAADEDIQIYHGANLWFTGRIENYTQTASGNAEDLAYSAVGPWWYLENIIFQVEWKYGSIPQNSSHILLNLHSSGGLATTREQLLAILNYAAAKCGAFQVGTILANTSQYVPVSEIRDTTCAEAVRNQLRWHPSAATRFDYSVSPPALHIYELHDFNIQPLTLYKHVTNFLAKPRHDLIRDAVVINYEVTSQIDNKDYIDIVRDAWPQGSTGQEVGAMVATVPIQGATVSNTIAEIVTEAIPDLPANPVTSGPAFEWWKNRFPAMRDPRIGDGTSNDAFTMSTMQRKSGSLNLGYELLRGQVSDWMRAPGNVPAQTDQEEISAYFSYTLYDSDAGISAGKAFGQIKKFVNVRMDHKFTACNLPSGIYSTQSVEDAGDPMPPIGYGGLANYLQGVLSELYYDGSMTVSSNEITDFSRFMGARLRVTGWSEYNDNASLIVQTVSEDVDTGEVHVTFGTPRHIQLNDLMDLVRNTRTRVRQTSGTTYTTGEQSSEASTKLGKDTNYQNGLSDHEIINFLAVKKAKGDVSSGNPRIILDADSGGLESDAAAIARIVIENGGTPGKKVNIRLADCVTPANHGSIAKELKIREVEVCWQNQTAYMLVLGSQVYDANGDNKL